MKRILFVLLAVLMSVMLIGCKQKEPKNTIKVGTIAGPESQLMEVAKEVALKRYGLHVDIIVFSDYTMPNVALNDGDIDANMFQHLPYLEAQIKARGYKLVSIGKTFIYPMGIYSNKIKSLSQIPDGAKAAIPNDPSNEARALLLLQKAGLIKLAKGKTINATPADIVSNPKHLKFIELDAAELPRALSDVMIATINTNYAIPAGLSPKKDALYSENKNSLYANIIAVREGDKNNPKLKELVASLHSPQVLKAAKEIFGDGAIQAW